MKPSEVTISGLITVGSEQWSVRVKAKVEAVEYKAMLAEIDEMIVNLKKAGFATLRLQPPRATAPTPASSPNGNSSAALTWPAPKCPDCDKDMKISKYQHNEKMISYYCTSKTGVDNFCKRSAMVDKKSGKVEYPEVSE